jgi:pimeloyl-ACP methyl ester carboxylesterase
MTTSLLWIAAAAIAAFGDEELPRVVAFGGDRTPGILVNTEVNGRPFDPRKPTLVFVHGLNPAPRFIHFPMAERLGEAVARRGIGSFNVLGWDWNGATLAGLTTAANQERAVRQGEKLAAALLALPIDPSRLHLIGQSAGTIVAASAARVVARTSGRRIAQISLLDPAANSHELVFGVLEVGQSGEVVENAFAPGPSGLGQAASQPNVRNFRVESNWQWSGTIDLRYSSHLNVVRWYLMTVADPSQPWGFNASVFAAGGTAGGG